MRSSLSFVFTFAFLLPDGRSDLESEVLAVAQDFDLVLLARLHLGECLRVVVDVSHVATGELQDFVSGLQPCLLRRRAFAHAVELESVRTVWVRGNGSEVDAEARRE